MLLHLYINTKLSYTASLCTYFRDVYLRKKNLYIFFILARPSLLTLRLSRWISFISMQFGNIIISAATGFFSVVQHLIRIWVLYTIQGLLFLFEWRCACLSKLFSSLKIPLCKMHDVISMFFLPSFFFFFYQSSYNYQCIQMGLFIWAWFHWWKHRILWVYFLKWQPSLLLYYC